MVPIKTDQEIEYMRQGGKISAKTLVEIIKAVKPGVTLVELDALAERVMLQNNAEPSFKRVYGYRYSTCININDGLVHGIPTNRKIVEGDVIKLDLGAFYKGFNTDLSYSLEVGSAVYAEFLNAGKEALKNAITVCKATNRLGDVCSSIQKTIEKEGYSVSRELIGHGVGRLLHEDPEIPGYGVPGTGLVIKKGMVFALEVIYQLGKPDISYEKDGWTIITKDRSMAGLFEHTVAITDKGPEILTSFNL